MIASWEAGRSSSGPETDGQLETIVEVMLGTSARIDEMLAPRLRDPDVTDPVPSIRIASIAVSRKGEAIQRRDHPKTAEFCRTTAILSFAAGAVRMRLFRLPGTAPDALRVRRREARPLTTSAAFAATRW